MKILTATAFLALLAFGRCQTPVRIEPGITVIVTWPNGTPLHNAHLEVHDKSGRTVLQAIAEGGVLEIEDLPFGAHSIIVEKGSCAEVVLNNIRFYLDAHPVLRVVRNDCAHSGDGAKSGCEVAVRVSNSDGNPIPNAVAQSMRYGRKRALDSYGRGEVALAAGQHDDYSISAPGYNPTAISADCVESERIEKTVELPPAQRKQ